MTIKHSLPQLPIGWTLTTIGELSEKIHYGYTASAVSEPVGPKLLRITDIQNDNVDWEKVPYCTISKTEKSKYLLDEGDLVFARTGATVGKSFLIRRKPPESVFASYLIRIILSKHIQKEFVSNFFKSGAYWLQIKRGQLGIGQPNVNSQILSKIVIPLAPLNEQKRIVGKVEELFSFLDAGVDSLRKVQAQLKRYRQAVLKYAFEGKLTEEWRRTHKEQIEPAQKLLDLISRERKTSGSGKIKKAPQFALPDLPESPDGWSATRIGDICNLINGRAFKPSEWASSGVPIIRIQNLNNSEAEFNYCNFEVEERYLVDNGQLLFAWSGTPGTSFGAHIWNRGKAVLNQHIFKVNINENFLDKTFLKHLFNCNVKEYIGKAHGTAGLAHITKAKFEDSVILLPPFIEQKRIADEIEYRLSISDVTEKAVEQIRLCTDQLRHSVLKDAFMGKLIPQNPNDEPAEKLLDHIKAERFNDSNPKTDNQLELSHYVK